MNSVDISLDGLSVMIGIPAGRDLPIQTAKSLFATQARCMQMGIPIHLGMIANCAVIEWARDEVADLFLGTDANRLFWIDSDMVWEPEQFIRMLALSKLREVVTAAYPAKNDRPTFYVSHDKAVGLVAGEYGLVEIFGLGLGFTVMQRGVIERLAQQSEQVEDEVTGKVMAALFRVDHPNRRRRGEDMAFFSDVRDLGYQVWLDPDVALGHVGQKVYRGSIRDAMT